MIAGFLRYSDVANILVHDDFIVLWRQNSLMLIGSILSNYKTDQLWKGTVLRLDGTGDPYCPIMLLSLILELQGYQRSEGPDMD
jgi:hypothetical protein